jgi:hypothetical protein
MRKTMRMINRVFISKEECIMKKQKNKKLQTFPFYFSSG